MKEHEFEIREFQLSDQESLIIQIAKFRQYLRSLKKVEKQLDFDEAKDELFFYLKKSYPIYVAVQNDTCIGFVVCRVEDEIVWAESLFVDPKQRCKHVGSLLFDRANQLAQSFHQDSLYVYVHPNNELMINFLASKGYDVLNLIEIRKQHQNESITSVMRVGEHTFKY